MDSTFDSGDKSSLDLVGGSSEDSRVKVTWLMLVGSSGSSWVAVRLGQEGA